MEDVGSWRPEFCCEINTSFYGGGFLETNAVQNKGFRVRTSNKRLDYISGRADKKGFIRNSFGIRKSEVILEVTQNKVSHSRRETTRADSRSPAKMGRVLGSH
jgi:hypothetical protein